MNAKDVVALLDKKGITRSEAAIKKLVQRYDLYLPRTETTSYSGLDPVKMKGLVTVLSSPRLIASIAKEFKCPYSRVIYYIMKFRIDTEKKYGFKLIKHEKDLKDVRKHL